MCVALVVLLSVAVLHSASAGGAYCSKTAAARAAALGLEYPGQHGAPDLSEAHLMYPRSFNYEVAAAEPNWAFYQQSLPGGRSSMDNIYPRSSSGFHLSHGMYPEVPSDYTTDHVFNFPKATLSDYPGPHFREVKHVASPAQGSSSGMPELTFWSPRGFSQPHSHVSSKQPLAVDEIGPIVYDMSLGGLAQPRSAGHAVDQSDFADAGFESGAVEPRGYRHLKKLRHLPPAWKILELPANLYKNVYSLPFVRGKAYVNRT